MFSIFSWFPMILARSALTLSLVQVSHSLVFVPWCDCISLYFVAENRTYHFQADDTKDMEE
jgi:hypothetical protein